MCDKLVYDLAQEVEGSPAVFVRKDWVNILDNQNQNYGNNQSVLDTSQLSNSNKYMSYREAYLLVPFTISLASTASSVYSAGTNPPNGGTTAYFSPGAAATSADNAIGLKNWFGQIIHSFTLDYNGTTIIQQTPLVNMWNSFKLMTSLSYQDLLTQGATIGFWPDSSDTFQFVQGGAVDGVVGDASSGFIPTFGPSAAGTGTCNNTNFMASPTVSGEFAGLRTGTGNEGFAVRQRWINFNPDGYIGTTTATTAGVASSSTAYFGNLMFAGASTALWKSYIFKKLTGTSTTSPGIIQIAVSAAVYLKHIHSFFNMVPLLKGVFMKMTMNLNNTTTAFSTISVSPVGANYQIKPRSLVLTSVSNPIGGVNPLMIASAGFVPSTSLTATTYTTPDGGLSLFQTGNASATAQSAAITCTITYRMNISVGALCLDSTIAGLGAGSSPLAKSVYLYIPAYSFNPVFEQAYLSSPVKEIKYSDIYQYQVINVGGGQTFNNLVTNGIANIKSVLILPFHTSTGSSADVSQSGLGVPGTPVWQSPFDPAGTGPTSPMCAITNFNVQISGQNAIYNMEKYSFEQFNNQLYGYNAVNGGLTDGLTSGLVSRYDFDNCYCYYYVDVSRMLPVEMTVPKSVQIIGQNMSSRSVDLIVFVEYGVSISVDLLTGARV